MSFRDGNTVAKNGAVVAVESREKAMLWARSAFPYSCNPALEDDDEKDSVIVVCCQFLFCDGEFFALCFADFRILKI